MHRFYQNLIQFVVTVKRRDITLTNFILLIEEQK